MYREFETETSYKYLQEVISSLDEPICILGGWAVFFHANKKFEKAQGRPYLGSRDIDLGFEMSDAGKNVMKKSISVLTEKLRFRQVSFRLLKEIHTETEEELEDSKTVPSYFIFPMYVDLMVDSIPKDFKKEFGFNPIDEPLLKVAFKEKKFTAMSGFGKKLLLPAPELLLAMKAHALPNRGKDHKKIKDICDMFALAWYSNINPENADLLHYLPEKELVKCLQAIGDDDYGKAAIQIGHGKEEVKRVISLLCANP